MEHSGTDSDSGREIGLLSFETPLDKANSKPVFTVRSLDGREGISELFNFDLELICLDPKLRLDTLLGKRVDIGVRLSGGDNRYFNGFVRRFSQLPPEGTLSRYEAQIVPWPWFLTKTTDCRIFQDRTVPQIIADVFDEFGYSDYESKIERKYVPCEYCVQYRETCWNFIARLMEREGITFYFKHQLGRHTLILLDSPHEYEECPYGPVARYHRFSGAGLKQDQDTIVEWCQTEEVRSTRYVLEEFDFKSPRTNLRAMAEYMDSTDLPDRELFDYPGGFHNREEGETWSEVRLDAEKVLGSLVKGSSTCRFLAAGSIFEARDLDRFDQCGHYLLISIVHQASEQPLGSSAIYREATYTNAFVCVRRQATFRSMTTSQRPTVVGSQTAIVVGPAGEEIYTDRYGRVKVQFPWDRRGQKNEQSSCWIRVSHMLAGDAWGAISIPRIGQEVIVEFLNGDPDRPIITGSVYNAENVPPYALPDLQALSGFKSRTSKKGDRNKFNEIRFDDRNSKEQLLIHAERDKSESVERDSEEFVGRDRSLFLNGNQIELVKGNKHSSVEGELREKIGADISLQVGGERHERIGSLYTAEVGQEIHLKAGTKIVIEAGAQVTLRAPGGFVDVGPGGVTIQGTLVKINSGGGRRNWKRREPEGSAETSRHFRLGRIMQAA